MDNWKYNEARRRVKKVKGFYSHFTSWLLFSVFFIFLNLTTGGHEFWAIFPIIGWGAGISSHAMEVFNYNPFLGKNWEERKIRELMDKEDK